MDAQIIENSLAMSGFQAIYDVEITNETYFNFDSTEVELFSEGGIVCRIVSNISERPIKNSEKLLFIIGDFATKKMLKLMPKNLFIA